MGKKKDSTADTSGNGEIVFGPFWQVYPDSDVKLYHEGLNGFLREKGFLWLKMDGAKRLCRTEGKIIEETDIGDITQFIYQFISSDKVPEMLGYGVKKAELLNLFVRGIDNYINTPKLRLLPIKELEFHFDTKTECFFYCRNGVVKITADSITIDGYISLPSYIWKSQIKPRVFTLLDSVEPPGDYEVFCRNICERKEDKFLSLRTIIGYILYRRWSASQPVIPCLLDTTTVGTETAEGGVGKSLAMEGLSFTRNMVVLDGKIFKPDSNFSYSRITPGTEIIYIDDLDRSVSFESWFGVVSGGLEVEMKFKDTIKIPRARTPKIGLSSNFPIKSVPGRSTERRKMEFECGRYYSERKPIDDFGRELYNEWDETEFNRMLNFHARCVQDYLKFGLVAPPVSVNSGLRKLNSELGGADLREFLDEQFCNREKNKLNKRDLYDEFLSSHKGQSKYYPSQNRFILKVHKYLDFHKAEYIETPANTRRFIEITEWGDIPFTAEAVNNPATNSYQTIADAPHKYNVVEPTDKEDEPQGTVQ